MVFQLTNTVPVYTLTVSYAGTGAGNVTRDPNQSSYSAGTVVTLTAAAEIGSLFDGWSGDAHGATSPITLTMDADKVVTATFDLEPTPTATATPTATESATPTATQSATPTATESVTPTATQSATPTAAESATPTATATTPSTITPTTAPIPLTVTTTPSAAYTATPTRTPPPTVTPTPQPGAISLFGWVYLDDGDGVREAGESSGLGGVWLSLRRSGWTVAWAKSWAPHGWYQFNTMTPGQYDVLVEVPAGYLPTSATQVSVQLVSGSPVMVDFGMQAYAPSATATLSPTTPATATLSPTAPATVTPTPPATITPTATSTPSDAPTPTETPYLMVTETPTATPRPVPPMWVPVVVMGGPG